MARIAGINIPPNKIVSIGLTYIHGIGLYHSKNICDLALKQSGPSVGLTEKKKNFNINCCLIKAETTQENL